MRINSVAKQHFAKKNRTPDAETEKLAPKNAKTLFVLTLCVERAMAVAFFTLPPSRRTLNIL